MLNGVIIEENDVFKMNRVVSAEEIPALISMVNEGQMAINRYVEPLEPFLAIILTEQCPAKIQGLKHKYPLAFTNWEKLPYRNARLFSWGTLEQEQTSRVAYALLHYAKKDESLAEELKQLFKKEFSEIDQYCSELKEGHALTGPEALHLSRQVIKFEEEGSVVSLVSAYALVDCFVDIYGLSYDYETEQEELLDRLAFLQRAIKVLLIEHSQRGYNASAEKVDDRSLKGIKAKIKPYVQAYEEKIGMDLVKYCRELIGRLEYFAIGRQSIICRQFGQDVRSLMKTYPMQISDIDHLIYTLLGAVARESGIHQDPTCEQFCDYLDKHFLESVLTYTHAKAFVMDRQFFFKTQGFSDAQMLQSLQNEVKQSQQKIEELSRVVAGFEDEKAKLKESYLKQMSQQSKAANEELVLANQENRKLQKEIEELKAALELANEQLMEADELSDMKANDSLESWESKQARWMEKLNNPEILIVGCHPRTIHRLKPMLPNAKYYELDTNIQDHYLVGVKHIFICLHQVNHAMTFKLDRCCPEIPRYPIRKTNAQLIVQELAQTLGIE